ncbi:hypothetical protein PVNG_02426 [Plasmodium vivax North Korean]|uniref:GMP synthase C-terminal domain-containing protein n=1 Tax=Plasmodium vivax North Korean TaxID=1035514 RepID=A0A0J9W6R7_PLAVI|nr:hypothetical protein PVNG_02426 [Plasmodium vivax North Korean]
MIGARLNIPSFLLAKQTFPSSGLATRVIGEITQEKIKLLCKIHQFLEGEIKRRRLDQYVSQYFPALLSDKTVGIKGYKRVYGYAIVIRAVKTQDFMSATVAKLPFLELIEVSNLIVSQFSEITRVLYDLTTKPAANIE